MVQQLRELNELQVETLMIADRAEAVNGKLYVMGGGWDQLNVPDLQQAQPVSFAITVLIPRTATNRLHRLQVRIEDEDSNPIGAEAQIEFSVSRAPLGGIGPQRAVLAMPALPVLFPRYGTYLAKAEIPGLPVRMVLLHVVNPSNPAQGMHPA